MRADYFSDDINEFLHLLSEQQVRYLIVGGEAAIYYGSPRLTGDIDIFYKLNEENCRRLYQVLFEFWDGDVPGITKWKDLNDEGLIIQFGVPPNRIDLINNIDGITFDEAYPERKKVELEQPQGVTFPVYFIGIKHLIRNKESTNRPKDQEDLKYLRKG